MVNKIENDEQLQAERERIHQLLEVTKNQISNDFHEIKEDLKPVSQVTHAVGNLFSNHNKSYLLKMGVSIGVDILLNKLILRRAGFITRLIVPPLVKNFALNYLNENKIKALQKTLLFIKFLTQKKDKNTDKNSIIINYPSVQKLDTGNSLNQIH